MWNMLLRSDLPSDLLEGMDYAVFGLGDTAYEKFCWAAKKLARRVENLGGREICPRGEGDEQHPFGYVTSPIRFLLCDPTVCWCTALKAVWIRG
jgi:sulfite reductase alpha subunit-like flavoprotein